MGACLAVDEAAARSRLIDKQNKKDFNNERRIVKLLLLGTGGSGKSTILKQMKILHGLDGGSDTGLTEADRKLHVSTCRRNVLDSIVIILSAYAHSLPSHLSEAALRVMKAAESVGCGQSDGDHGDRVDQDVGLVYTEALAEDVANLWSEVGIQTPSSSLHQLYDSAPYFLGQAERLAAYDYIPTDEDILRARSVTSGIVVVPFQEKLKTSNLSDYLPEYPGSEDFRDALRFLKRKYLRMNKNPNRDIYSFETTATDTELVKNIFGAINEIILNKILSSQGFE